MELKNGLVVLKPPEDSYLGLRKLEVDPYLIEDLWLCALAGIQRDIASLEQTPLHPMPRIEAYLNVSAGYGYTATPVYDPIAVNLRHCRNRRYQLLMMAPTILGISANTISPVPTE